MRRYALVPKHEHLFSPKGARMKMDSTIAVDLDGNGIKALYSHQTADEVVAALKKDGWVTVENYRIPAASVKYVQEGRRSLPVSSAPSSNALAEHAAIVSGVHQ